MSYAFDDLYHRTQRDTGIVAPAWVSMGVPATSSASAQVANTFTNSSGRLFIVRALVGEFFPGGGQNVVAGRLALMQPTAGNPDLHLLAADHDNGAADETRWVNWSGEVMCPPGWLIRATGDFNAGAAANQSRLFIHGLLVPLGNVIYQSGA